MRNLLFYLATVLIWGSTWIGIKLQLGNVAPIISVAYRFLLAALILLAWCRIRRLPMRFSLQDHGFIFLQGLLLFGCNYLLFYIAELYIASGLAAVIFSTIVVMNILNGALFLKTPIDFRVVVGAVLGLAGIVLVFHHEIVAFSLDDEGFRGALICVVATLFASLGNIVSARNQMQALPIIQTNAYGMGYGALVMVIAALVTSTPFTFDPSPIYVLSLVYLALFGSVIAFGCYLSLIGSIGADRAAYSTLLFPIVALTISTIWEGYRWSVVAAAGVGLILLGNLFILRSRRLPVRKG
ncbi:MAG: EamA family transporter [Desulfofustis sp.]|nr:EamA family transporter [Desulfofustis sp.]